MARRAEDLHRDPAVLLVDDDDVTPEALAAWLDNLDDGETIDTKTSAADELRLIRADGNL